VAPEAVHLSSSPSLPSSPPSRSVPFRYPHFVLSTSCYIASGPATFLKSSSHSFSRLPSPSRRFSRSPPFYSFHRLRSKGSRGSGDRNLSRPLWRTLLTHIPVLRLCLAPGPNTTTQHLSLRERRSLTAFVSHARVESAKRERPKNCHLNST
jgi:hypothetical protein